MKKLSSRISDFEYDMRKFSEDISDTKRRTWDILSSLADFSGEGLDEWIEEVSDFQAEVTELEDENEELQRQVNELEYRIAELEQESK